MSPILEPQSSFRHMLANGHFYVLQPLVRGSMRRIFVVQSGPLGNHLHAACCGASNKNVLQGAIKQLLKALYHLFDSLWVSNIELVEEWMKRQQGNAKLTH